MPTYHVSLFRRQEPTSPTTKTTMTTSSSNLSNTRKSSESDGIPMGEMKGKDANGKDAVATTVNGQGGEDMANSVSDPAPRDSHC